MALTINEIFYSIQGESLYSGLACVFVRLSGCNLRCTYCDTQYAYTGGFAMQIPEIVDKVIAFGCPLVEITGGEPLFQHDTPLLIDALVDGGHTVLMETNGSFDVGVVNNRCKKIIDIKCPSSGESQKSDLNNLNRLNPGDQIKFVIACRDDYDYAKTIKRQIPSDFLESHILFSPVYGKLALPELAEWILKDKLNVRLHIQLHKLIWPLKDRGV